MRQPLEEVEALRSIRDALARGTKRSRLRILTVVCPSDGHALVEVFPTPVGPYAVWSSHERWHFREDGERELRPAPDKIWWAEDVGVPDTALPSCAWSMPSTTAPRAHA